jgi:hypothetical protein
MIVVLVWLLFAIFSAALASSKNRSAFGWFFCGLLLGPFGLLVALFPKVELSAEERTTRPCPFCSQRIKREAKRCDSCNRNLP